MPGYPRESSYNHAPHATDPKRTACGVEIKPLTFLGDPKLPYYKRGAVTCTRSGCLKAVQAAKEEAAP